MNDSTDSELFNQLIDGLKRADQGERIGIVLFSVLVAVILVIIFVVLFCVAMKIKKIVFNRIEEKNGNSITLQFLEKVVSLVLIVVFIVIPLGGDEIAKSLLGSTAVIAAVVGLAANDVIKNMFAGLEISIYKPFDLKSRIMLEDGRVGIVEKMTLRHVVLVLIDTTRLIIPNSKINSMLVTNYSYIDEVPRSFEVKFAIDYSSDLKKAKEVIRKTICECPLTLNEDKYDETKPNSKSVYFLEIKDSCLVLGATVYYPHEFRTEVVKDEINTRVFEALAKNGIEIPYNYVNVVMKPDV
ncbi:MAG: mechanosensitive ion channel family protein [Butyrivibrio sp.]|nr:mechanosensitive ion channel family protein [Butyrivibrio sp.]